RIPVFIITSTAKLLPQQISRQRQLSPVIGPQTSRSVQAGGENGRPIRSRRYLKTSAYSGLLPSLGNPVTGSGRGSGLRCPADPLRNFGSQFSIAGDAEAWR